MIESYSLTPEFGRHLFNIIIICAVDDKVSNAGGGSQHYGRRVLSAGHQQAGELHGGALRQCLRPAAGVGGRVEGGVLGGHAAVHERGAGRQERPHPHP